MVLLLAGISWTLGLAVRTRTLAFPFMLLLTMIPLPMLVFNRITLPLQLLSSQAATAIIQAFGNSVYRDGNVLHLPHTTLGVAEACSGLHSLASLVVVSLLLGFVECRRLVSAGTAGFPSGAICDRRECAPRHWDRFSSRDQSGLCRRILSLFFGLVSIPGRFRFLLGSRQGIA